MKVSSLPKRAWNSLCYRGFRGLDAIKRATRIRFPKETVSRFSDVLQFSPEGDGEYQLYQTYYENCIREFVRFKKTNFSDKFAEHTTHVGQYIFRLKGGREIKVAFDAHDHRNIRSAAILDWSDIYFKSNRWPGIDYGPKVLPIPIGNAGITLENCRYLRGLRQAKKELDLVFVGRIWSGGDANVEHNLRLFENLAKVKCKSRLLAVVFAFDKESEAFRMIARRLNKAGVEMTDGQIGYGDLMKMSASSKLVVLRAGISGCIAWRMVDMLAMGACLVLDRAPFPEWPLPLKEDVNFLSLGTRITEDCRPAPKEDYARIPFLVESALNSQTKIQKISEENGLYFDKNLHPLQFAFFISYAITK
jgi:hypothetical protein